MKAIKLFICSLMLVFSFQSVSMAQSVTLTKTYKNYFNRTVQKVQQTNNADEKRAILNNSFSRMITAIDKIESLLPLSEKNATQLNSYKNEIADKKNELNGTDGFVMVNNNELDQFANFSQQSFEQADRTLTIGLTAALLIVIIIILLA